MPVIVDCRSCGRKLRVTDELLGRKVQCPGCGEAFDAESPPPEPNGYRASGENGAPSPAERFPPLEPDRRLPEEEDDRPWERPSQPQVRRDCEPERGSFILILGIVSLLLPVIGIVLGLAAWIMGTKDLRKMRGGQMDPQGQGTTQAGLICGIVGFILQLLFTLCIGVYVGFIVMMVAAVSKPMRAMPAPAMPATMKLQIDEEMIVDPDDPGPAPKQPVPPRPPRGKR